MHSREHCKTREAMIQARFGFVACCHEKTIIAMFDMNNFKNKRPFSGDVTPVSAG